MSQGDHVSSLQEPPSPPTRSDSGLLRDLLTSEAIGGGVALVAAVIAVVWANIDLGSYAHLQHLHLGPLSLEHWAADGGLTLFFFVAGLELKREFTTGSLRDPRAAAIPIAAACCGVAVPALIFVVLDFGTGNLKGWAIPAPTDVAFALAVLAILGRRVSSALRVFLLTLAVVDDLIVIAIIAFAYSDDLKAWWILGAIVLITAYALLFRIGSWPRWLFVPIALGAWWCALHSGIHPTVAGILLALLTPATRTAGERLEHLLAPWSAGLAVPVFALTSAGVPLTGGAFGSHVFWGVFVGLVVGKPLGIVLGASAVSRWTGLPWDGDSGSGFRQLLGLGFIAGIGFTVALLVSDLAFADQRVAEAKTAVLMASTSAAVIGVIILGWGRAPTPATRAASDQSRTAR